MVGALANMAERVITATENFLNTLQEIAGITRADAIKVLAVYRKARVIKMDTGIGRISVKHGVFLEEDVIRNALR